MIYGGDGARTRLRLDVCRVVLGETVDSWFGSSRVRVRWGGAMRRGNELIRRVEQLGQSGSKNLAVVGVRLSVGVGVGVVRVGVGVRVGVRD